VAPDHNYQLVDMLWEDLNFEEPADIVGISVRMTAEKTAFRIADHYREKGIMVVLGGPQVSSNPLASKEHADAVVIGEGEKLWPIILEDYKNKALKDFYVCSPEIFESKGHSVFQLENLPELKGLPIPRRDLFKRKYTFDMVFASRGCPINCDFCSVSNLFGKKYRFKPVEDVVKEINSFRNYYYLIDDTVFGRPSTFNYYLSLYDQIALLPKKRYWTGQANLDAATHETGREVIRKAVNSGLIYLAIGMESINEEVLKKSGSYSKMGISKDEDVMEKMKQNISFIQDQGIMISGWFAIGYEDDDLDTYYRTFEFCREMNLLPVFTPVNALKGTALYTRMINENRLQDNAINMTNIPHHSMNSQQVMEALDFVAKKGYNLSIIIRRTLFYMRKMIRNKGNSVNDIMHKTIFNFITQIRMGQIVRSENERLRKKLNHKKEKDV
jgi:radical SAM superfamily enzyme YgiQ (UPF0313 family)